ncbi:hypothetical protein [Agaribacter marinus]|uniref:Uncharacterized protein n=1 Tax=Agaribacter marinus TaxID=1431249 RepID=A0AA37T3S2_9ALTE|nr:hypothetical protein [Agaribacter marinus]GLR72639.1 hypothetical protein GCM10007852_35470 [Agaribacter marinus]
MDIQGNPNLAYAMEVKSINLANSQQKQEGQAVQQLLESAAPPPPTGSSGFNINTYA